jgi:hypothetical protein
MECVPGPSSMPQRGIAAIAPLPEQPQSPVAVHSASQVESGSRLVTPRSMGFQGSRTEQMPRQPGTLQGLFDARYTVSDAFVGSTRMAGEHVEKAISTDSKERHVSLLVCTVAFAPDVDYCSTIDQGTQRHKKYTGQNSRNFPTVRGSHGSGLCLWRRPFPNLDFSRIQCHGPRVPRLSCTQLRQVCTIFTRRLLQLRKTIGRWLTS